MTSERSTSSAAAWNRALMLSLAAGLLSAVVGFVVLRDLQRRTYPGTFYPEEMLRLLPSASPASTWAAALVLSHMVFTLCASVGTSGLGTWRPSSARDEVLTCFNTAPPAFSPRYAACVALLLPLEWLAHEVAVNEVTRLDRPGADKFPLAHFAESAGLAQNAQGLLLAGLAVVAVVSWIEWLFGLARVEVRGGEVAVKLAYSSFAAKTVVATGRTLLVGADSRAVCLRLPGGRSGEVWAPTRPSRAASPGYRDAEDEGVNAFFARPGDKPPLPMPHLGGDERRWKRLHFLGLFWVAWFGLDLVRVAGSWPSRLLYYAGTGVLLLASWLVVSVLVHPLDRHLRRPRGAWRWRDAPTGGAERSSVRALVSASRREPVFSGALLVVGALASTGAVVVVGLAAALIPQVGVLAPAVALIVAALWVVRRRFRIGVRIVGRSLSVELQGTWLPVTRVEVREAWVVLTVGSLEVHVQELIESARASDPHATASLIWPFCAPATAFAIGPEEGLIHRDSRGQP